MKLFKKATKTVEMLHIGIFVYKEEKFHVFVLKETKDNLIPHIHVASENSSEEYIIQLLYSKYYSHGSDHIQTMPPEMEREFGIWMGQPNLKSSNNAFNWYMGLLYWVGLNRLIPGLKIPDKMPPYFNGIGSAFHKE